ncbi:MAG: toxin glutamine deamidase domain-containing protein [Clostridiales bacterium]|nr:toxin glutamine deamidase domain-containing protein [Clostridiales bacterium]
MIKTVDDATKISNQLKLLSSTARKQLDEEIAKIISLYDGGPEKRALYFAAMQEIFGDLTIKYGTAAQAIALDVLERQEVPLRTLVDVYGNAMGKAITGKAIQEALQSRDAGAAYLRGALDHGVKRGYREQITIDAPLFARIPTGAYTCPWCVSIASLGFIDRRTAPREFWQYHNYCDCVWMPAQDAKHAHVDGYDPDYLSKLTEKGEGIGERPDRKPAFNTQGNPIKAKTGSRDITIGEKTVRRGAPMSIKNALGKSNIGGYKNNCQRCVPAYELRRRGFNVTAKSRQTARNAIRTAADWFDVTQSKFYLDKAALLRALETYEDGARFAVRQRWVGSKLKDPGHVYVAEKINGKIIFIDPQSGIINYDGIDQAKQNSIQFFRMDNANFKPDIKFENMVEIIE